MTSRGGTDSLLVTSPTCRQLGIQRVNIAQQQRQQQRQRQQAATTTNDSSTIGIGADHEDDRRLSESMTEMPSRTRHS